MTLIAKAASENGIETNYEFTPFREESGYADHRHPDEIMWSDSLIADAKRRDFTINCLYYTAVQSTGSDDSAVIILQDHEWIEKIFAK